MISSTIFNRLSGLRTLGLAVALAGISIFWACHLNEADSKDHFDLKLDAATAQCDSLLVILEDVDGKPLDTLFNDTLASASQLSNLDVGKYRGGKAQVRILGRKDGGVCVEQTRGFDDKGGKVEIDTLALPEADPQSVALNRTLIEISVGDANVEVKATLTPAFAGQLFDWSIDDASVANVEFPDGQNGGRLLVIPQKNGVATIQVRAKKDPSKKAVLVVRVGSVGGKTISVVPESLSLFLGGPDSLLASHVSPEGTDEKIRWTSGDDKIATVDAEGKVKPIGAGATLIKAGFGGATASVAVKVKRDIPILTVASASGAAVNVPIAYSPKSIQQFGSIVLYKWDLAGDGEWDDSLPGPFLGATVDLPPQTMAYAKQGHFKPLFLVRDSEGNEAMASVEIDIGDQPPEILSISADTLISIKDSVPLAARAKDLEGKVVWMGWDFENDGKFDDTVKGDQASLELKSGHRYPKVGVFSAVLRAEDDNGKVRTDTVKVTVELLPPIANAGNDTTVIAGTPIRFRVLGEDSLGTITKRELKIGSGPFLNLSGSDTSITLPGDSGSVPCVARITDDDGNSDEDTMVVTLKAPSLSNNDLAGLVASAGTLAPSFKPLALAYSLQVTYADSQVSLTASPSDSKAEMAINGKPVDSGEPSDPVDIKVGTVQDVFKVVVTAQDGSQKTYAISVTRLPSNDTRLSKLEPAGFALKPGFSPALLEYADTVASAVASVSLKPTPGHPSAKVTVNDSLVVSGSSSKPVPLIVGDNLIKVEVTAQDGKTKAVYNLKVVRRARLIVTRLVMDGSPELIDSVEAPLGTSVTLSAKDTVGFHFARWNITAGTGTLQDSLANPGKVTLKSAIVRVRGLFAINVYKVRTGFAGFKGGQFSVDTALVEHGKDTTLTLTPLTGYRVLALTDNGKEVKMDGPLLGARTYSLKGVTGNHLIEAAFKRVYTLSVSVTGTGTMTPAGATVVDSGATQVFAIASGSPSEGIIVSSLVDNGKESIGEITGDPMNASKYTLAGIDADHDIKAAFTIKALTLTVTGSDLCIRKVVSCPVGQICPIIIKLCLDGSGPSADTLTVSYGSSYTITTDDSLGTRPFLNWNKDGVNVSTAATITSGPLTANTTYNAVYKTSIIKCCPGICCVVIDPPILVPAATASEPVFMLQSREFDKN
jgi:cadherin-like protein/Big-like domain-containing protein